MAAKKKRKAAAPPKPKKRAGRAVKRKKASTKPKVRPPADIDNTPPPFRPAADDNTPPPPFRPSQPPSMHWDNSAEAAAAQIAAQRQTQLNAAVASTVGAVEPPLTLRSPPDIPQRSPALHAEMIERIEALERAMAGPRERRQRGIGHNNPPEPIEPAPLSANELREIRKCLVVLKEQPPAPIAPSTEVRTAVTLLTKFGDRLRPLARATGAYAGKQADNFVTAAVKESGKRIVQSPFWLAIIHQLPALADIAHRWLESLGPHL